MATLGELTRQHTSLDRDEIDHLQRLIGEWGLLADLSFADLLLYVPDHDGRWIVMAHVRPATGQTIYQHDWVGSAAKAELSLLGAARDTAAIAEGLINVDSVPEPVHMMAVPVYREGKVLGVLSREWADRSSRQPGELERTYVGLFQRFAQMIADGAFPFSGPVADS
ncbi:MAG: histidine kinase N-terminal domain-containing protein, partial [Actinomycetota bacterium]